MQYSCVALCIFKIIDDKFKIYYISGKCEPWLLIIQNDIIFCDECAFFVANNVKIVDEL